MEICFYLRKQNSASRIDEINSGNSGKSIVGLSLRVNRAAISKKKKFKCFLNFRNDSNKFHLVAVVYPAMMKMVFFLVPNTHYAPTYIIFSLNRYLVNMPLLYNRFVEVLSFAFLILIRFVLQI